MAIDSIPYPDAHNLVSKEKAFYPLRIPVSHWQLRHYISHPDPDHLYYASGHEVYCLYASTKKRKHIVSLPFEARCTASGYGWICVGGEEEGHFAAIKIDGSPREVDERLDLGPGTADPSMRRNASVNVERIGEEIVNSISIHRVQDEEKHMDDIVAVLTNNDKTVRVYSLPQNLETCVLDLPFAMNHATISPDGTMLVAVGDVNQAYFFQRDIKGNPPIIPKPHNRLTTACVDWKLSNVVTLHVSGPEASMGYFTTAWSPNGKLVAVGSEGGYISIMDVEKLNDPALEGEDTVVAVIPSSRPDVPQPHPGAVRTMIFSPDPWDLLIWAEDQGRVCIGDLRTGLKMKQVVTLDPKEEGLRRVEFEDLDYEGPVLPDESDETRNLDQLERDFLRRYRHAQESSSAVNFATEYIEARRRQRQHREDMASQRVQHDTDARRAALEGDPQGLTAREQEILSALRTTRQREEARSQGGVAQGVNYTTPDMFSSLPQLSTPDSPGSTDSTDSPPTQPLSDILSTTDPFPELSRTNANTGTASSSQLPPIRLPGEPNTWNPTPSASSRGSINAPSRLPRRRASVILSPPTNTTTTSPPTTGHPPDDSNPWRTIEDAMTLARGPLFDRATPTATSATTRTQITPSSSGSNALNQPPTVPTTTTNPTPAITPAQLAEELATERAARARSQAASAARHHPRYRALPPPTTGANTTALPATNTTTTDIRARLAATAGGFPEGYDVLRRLTGSGRFGTGREIGVRTAGLAMSADGGTLWVACEEGVFELNMRRRERMFWPAVQMR